MYHKDINNDIPYTKIKFYLLENGGHKHFKLCLFRHNSQLHILEMTLRSLTAISEFKLDAHSYIQTFSAYGIPYNRYNFLLTSKSCLSKPISLENDS